MKISDRIDELHAFVSTPAGQAKGESVRVQACEAIRDGMKSPKWREYMKNFASNPDQLKRLVGEDEDFNNTAWGLDTLAYITANSTCGVGTTLGTKNNMPDQMVEGMDFGVSDADVPIPD